MAKREAYNFGDVAEFTVWASSCKARLIQNKKTAHGVTCSYRKQTGRKISTGVVDRVFERLDIPLHTRPHRVKAISLGVLAREIILLNDRMRKLAKEVGCEWAEEFIAEAELDPYIE
jgi:hypothetical protein